MRRMCSLISAAARIITAVIAENKAANHRTTGSSITGGPLHERTLARERKRRNLIVFNLIVSVIALKRHGEIDMQNYNLTTWSGDRLVGYEPIVAASAGEAVAFAQGLLTERTRGETHFLVKMGVRYVVDHGHRALEELTLGTESTIGTWHTVEQGGGVRLLWKPVGVGN